MRLLIGLLFCLPLLAQDVEPGKEGKKEDRVVEVKIATEAEGKERAVELAKALTAETDPAKRDELIQELVEALTGQPVREALVPDPQLRIEVDPQPLQLRAALGANPFETMNGSWDDNGRKGTYTLKSLGKGRYRLEAKIEGEGTTAETIEKEGTLADLRRDYPFLKKGGTLFFNFAPEFEGVRLGAPLDAAEHHPDTFDSLRVFSKARTAEVGLVVGEVPEELAHHLVLVTGEGLLVKQVQPGSRAEQLGLRRFDVLMRLGDERIESPAQLKRLNGTEGRLEIIRRGERKTIELK